MSTQASAVGAFLLGMVVMVLLVTTGVFDHTIGRFLPHRPVEPYPPYSMTPLLVSVGPADGAQDVRCPPVYDVSNDTSRMIYFQNGASPPDDRDDGRYQNRAPTSDQDDERDDRNSYDDPNTGRDPRDTGNAAPDHTVDIGQRTVAPGGKIKIRTGYGGRHDCPRSIVKVWFSDGP